MSEFQQRVTIDLDGKVDEFEMAAVRAWHNLQRVADDVEVHVSSSGQGLHFVGYFRESVPFHEQVAIRRGLGDDPRRVDMDCQRWLNGLYTDVLFDDKSGRESSKERGFIDVWDALDHIRAQRDDGDRVRRLANFGHKGDAELARRMEAQA